MHIIKKIGVVICILIHFNSYGNQYKLEWIQSIDSVSTLSSPRAVDLNKDQVKDIILGVGNEYDSINYVIAINSKDGSTIWKTFVESDIYGSPIFFDVNQDQIEDVFISGRKNGLYAINGANGEIFWRIDETHLPDLHTYQYNFYQPQIIKTSDINSNEILITTYGGNSELPPYSTERKTGYIVLINPKNGQLIGYDSMPDGHETYYSLQIFDLFEEKQVLIGTGGETQQGNLWLCPLSDVLNNHFSSRAKKIDGPFEKGFIQPNLVTDINKDGTLDIISINFGGYVSAIDGKLLQKIWTLSFPGFEIYSPPTPIEFNHQEDIYLVVTLGEGLFDEGYHSFKSILINSKDGSYIEMNDWGYLYQINGGVSYKKDDQTYFISSYNNFENGQYQVEYMEIHVNENISKSITGMMKGNNLGSSPLLDDLDNDGFSELILLYNEQDFRSPSTVKIMRYDTDIAKNEIIWNNYMGSNNNYIFTTVTTTSTTNFKSNSKIEIYPNPTTDMIHIVSDSKIYQIEIFNTLSQKLYKYSSMISDQATIHLGGIPKGSYLILIQTENGPQISKIVVF